MSVKRAIKRYNRTIFALSAVYAVTLFAAIYVFNHRLVSGAVAVIVSMLPALPIIGMFAAIARYLIEESDEYIRMMEVRKTLVATGFALSIATIWGFMESFEVVGHVESFYIAVLWFGGLGVGSVVNRFFPPRAA
ncbi:MAG: hypothetical protein K2Y20_09810 [Sphingomonas sp.]|nr:hypothetical protein [Sphingomonas sp.]